MLNRSRKVSYFLPLQIIPKVVWGRANIRFPIGAQSILRAFTRNDFPEDQDRIFLTSWGEWWEKDVIEKTLDKKLQDKWSPSKDDIEKEEGILV